jgi:hypothetical protein
MTDLPTAMADNSKLSPYQGKDVLRTSISIRGAGDGLSEAMGIDPQELAIGAKGVLVLEFVVEGHKHKPIKDTNALSLEQILRAGTATLIDPDVVKAALDAQREKIDAAREAASGQARMLDTSLKVTGAGDEEPEDEVLLRNHGLGSHRDALMDGCPACDNERAAEAAEAAEDAAKEPAPA